MKTTIAYILFTLLFLVPPPLPRSTSKIKTAPVTRKQSLDEYTKGLDSALVSERSKNKMLRQQCLKQVQLLVAQQDGNRMEKDIRRLAGN